MQIAVVCGGHVNHGERWRAEVSPGEGPGQAGEAGWQESLLNLTFTKSKCQVSHLGWKNPAGGWLSGKQLCRRGSEEVARGRGRQEEGVHQVQGGGPPLWQAVAMLCPRRGSPVRKRWGCAGVSLAEPPRWLGAWDGGVRGGHRETSLLSAATPSQCPEVEPDPAQRCSVLVGERWGPQPDVGEKKNPVRVVKHWRGPERLWGLHPG